MADYIHILVKKNLIKNLKFARKDEQSDSETSIKSYTKTQTDVYNIPYIRPKKNRTIRIIFLALLWLLIIMDFNNDEDGNQSIESLYNATQEKIIYDNPLYDIIIPLGPNFTASILALNLKMVKKFFKTKIIFLAPISIKEETKKLCDDCEFIDETQIYPELNSEKIESFKPGNKTWRFSWFYQQFLKCGYAYKTKKEYYFILDYDTIPINNFSLFNPKNNKPYFSYSCDSWHDYYTTMKKLFYYEKEFNYSYVCEHMMFKTSIMKEMIELIERNNNLTGKYFYEKILDACNGERVSFSEYETYGTYVYNYYPDLYEYRHLRKSDNTKNFCPLNEKYFEYTALNYDTLRFERVPDGKSIWYILVKNKIFRRFFNIETLYKERNYITTSKFVD